MDGNNMLNNNDSMDINELASLNEDISPELIDKLQEKLSMDANNLQASDAALFEEPASADESNDGEIQTSKLEVKLDPSFDDNFIKKYKAKLDKQDKSDDVSEVTISDDVFAQPNIEEASSEQQEENISNNITARKVTQEQKDYNDSLDFLDGNVKYSKYVIYIDPQNVDFIESLTVKERKNLINKILKDQDDIAVTKHRIKKFQSVLMHIIIAIVTFVIAIPVIYWTINTSLEVTINNYRRSQANFGTLYREKGKISRNMPK